MNKKNLLPVSLIALAWALLGIGYQALVVGYLPQLAGLLAESVGLMIAGALTGSLLLTAVDSMSTRIGRIMLAVGYLLFAPLGMMAGLIAPGAYEPAGNGSWLTFSLVAPVLITLFACIAVGLGMGFTGGLALAAQRIGRQD